MPSLPLYLLEDDVAPLVACFADDFALIVCDGPGRWRATKDFTASTADRLTFWHLPSGPLPLCLADGGTAWIDDPFAGWSEKRKGADPSTPYFGPGHVGIVWLNLRLQGKAAQSRCGLSSLEWIGNRYSVIDLPAPDVTVKRWARLKRQIAKIATKMPRGGPDGTGKPEVWAMSQAVSVLGVGDINPF